MAPLARDFEDMLRDSERARFRVLDWLKEQGLDVELGDPPIDTPREPNHIDLGDIHIHINGKTGRIESKHNRDYNYKKWQDYHTDRIFIDSMWHIHHYPYKYPLCGYALVNQSITGLFWVPGFWKPRWFTTEDVYTEYDKKDKVFCAMSKDFLHGMYYSMEHHDKLPLDLVCIGTNGFTEPDFGE